MESGVVTFLTDYRIDATTLARAVEERGFTGTRTTRMLEHLEAMWAIWTNGEVLRDLDRLAELLPQRHRNPTPRGSRSR